MKFVPIALIAATSLALVGAVRSASIVSGETAHGFRFGSVAAKSKLIEYGSLNCPHCGAFAQAANPAIVRAVKSGRMLYEYRPIAIFPQDLAAHALAKCVPAGGRLSFIDDYYRNQRNVYARFEATTADSAANAALNAALSAGEAPAARKLALAGGMLPIAARHGLSPAAANVCLGNPAVLRWVGAATQAASAAGIVETPSFILNGKASKPDDVLAQLGR